VSHRGVVSLAPGRALQSLGGGKLAYHHSAICVSSRISSVAGLAVPLGLHSARDSEVTFERAIHGIGFFAT
jgi:hypothetical protein